jgi:hypothetical protein
MAILCAMPGSACSARAMSVNGPSVISLTGREDLLMVVGEQAYRRLGGLGCGHGGQVEVVQAVRSVPPGRREGLGACQRAGLAVPDGNRAVCAQCAEQAQDVPRAGGSVGDPGSLDRYRLDGYVGPL